MSFMNGSKRGAGYNHVRAGGPGQGYLRAAEREDFELRLGEIMGENKELRRQVAACKTQLAKMYKQIMIEGGRQGRAGGGGGGGGGSPQKRPEQQQFHRSTSDGGENWEEGDAGIDQLGAQVEAAREREAAARLAWQRAKSPLPSRRHGSKGRRGRNSASPGSPHTSGDERRSGSPNKRRDGASPKRSNAADEELLQMLRESEATTAALRSELLDRNASLVEALAEAKDLKVAVVDLQARADDAEARSREVLVELKKGEAERSKLVGRVQQLERELANEKFANRDNSNKDAQMAELMADLESLEEENRKLTLQSIQGIWQSGGGGGVGGQIGVPPRMPSSTAAPVVSSTSPRMLGSPMIRQPGSPMLGGTTPRRVPSSSQRTPGGGGSKRTGSGVGKRLPSSASTSFDAEDSDSGVLDRVCSELWSRFKENKPGLWKLLDKWSKDPSSRRIGAEELQSALGELMGSGITTAHAKKVFDHCRRSSAGAAEGGGKADEVEYSDIGRLYERGSTALSLPPRILPHPPKQVGTVKEEAGGTEEEEEDIEEYIEGNSVSGGRTDEKRYEGDDDDVDRAGDGNEVGSESFVSVGSASDSFDTSQGGDAASRTWSADASAIMLGHEANTMAFYAGREWLLHDLQDLYKLFRSKTGGSDRQGFLQAVGKVLRPIDLEVADLRSKLENRDKMFDKRLTLETKNLSTILEQFKQDRMRLEAQNSTLEAGLRRSQERLAALQQEHADLTDILRLISLSALERQRVLAGSRTGSMEDALKRGRESNREESMNRVQELERERDRLQEAHDILIECWESLPKDKRSDAASRLGRRELRHVSVEDGGTITVKAGSIKTLVDAKWGPAHLPLSECADVTEIVRVLVVKGGIGPVPVSESLFSTPLAQELAKQAEGTSSGSEGGTSGAGKGTSGSGSGFGQKRLVVRYASKEPWEVEAAPMWKLKREEEEMAKDALHSLAKLMDRWGVSSEEMINEFTKNSNAHLSDGTIRWEAFLQVLSEMPVEFGGEQELRSSLGMGGRDKRVDTAVLRSRLEAHYWFLSREALRKYVGSTNVVTLAGGTVLASRKEYIAQQQPSHQATSGGGSSGSDSRNAAAMAGTITELEHRLVEAEGRTATLLLYTQSLQIALGFERAHNDGSVDQRP